ncbi:MAG: peptidoglycan-binding protein [Cytophagales bacterium]|nr:peptidoglycan-binding protein [Armatimonadota bacterium]
MAEITDCATSAVRGLSRQIIAEMNLLIPGGALVSIADLPIEATGSAVTLFLQPPAKEALRDAIRDRGGATLRLSSAYRTVAQQFLLRRQFDQGRCGIPAAARPGRSNHEDGLALDTPDTNAWRQALEDNGWQWLGPGDRVHFSYAGAGTREDLGTLGVRAFQRLWNRYHPTDRLTEDGEFGAQTASRLASAPADGFPPPRLLRLATPPLTGEDIRRVQEALRTAGFPELPVTGIFGASTDSAVRAFQTREQLAADGIVGMATRRELGVLF